jgi:cytochrome c peroxidase
MPLWVADTAIRHNESDAISMKAGSTLIVLLAFAGNLQAATHDLTLQFRHLWNGEPVSMPSTPLITESGETISLTRLAYLLSDPYLRTRATREDEWRWIQQGDWQAHVDASEPAATVLKDLPAGEFTFLKFNIGLEEAVNHSDPSQYGPDHPLNTIRNNLHWTWAQGYIFLAMEGHLLASLEGRRDGFSYHIGNDALLIDIQLPLNMDLREDTTVVLDFHIDRLFTGEPAFIIAEQTSTHSREGDPLAEILKDRIEHSVTVGAINSTPATASMDHPDHGTDNTGTPYRFEMPDGFPIPSLPTDYPLTNERVALGQQLFTETLLSKSNTLSCPSCHHSDNGFSDPRRFSIGEEDRTGRRQSMPIFNMAWKSSFFWDGRAPSLREQALVPIEDHNEFDETLENVVRKLAEHPDYPARFADAFGDVAITPERLGIAIEQFVLTLTSLDSKFDRAVRGTTTLTDQEKRGLELFFTEYDPRRGLYGADCFHCHGGPFFTDFSFHNNGLVIDSDDLGRAEVTGKATDNHTFSTPSLRNAELTAPYMHDGRFESLDEVISHYNEGVVDSDTLDPNLLKHPAEGIGLSEEDQQALVAFLKTLTDPAL